MSTYTALVNKLLDLVASHPDFPKWQQKGKVSSTEVKSILQPLRIEAEFSDLPKRYFSSAQMMVTYIYESWLALQQAKYRSIKGKRRWLKIVEDDLESMLSDELTLQEIQARACEILERAKKSISLKSNKGDGTYQKKIFADEFHIR
jgi:hypothetical protein